MIAYSVVRRTNEIGIRIALGAAPVRILGMVVREAVTLITIGLAIGMVAALIAGKTAETVGIVASLLPATRAARLEPMTALREE